MVVMNDLPAHMTRMQSLYPSWNEPIKSIESALAEMPLSFRYGRLSLGYRVPQLSKREGMMNFIEGIRFASILSMVPMK